jgi:head-tail adaptor
VWASIEALNVREVIAGAALQTNITHTVSTRYLAALADVRGDGKLRVLYGARIFDISGSENVDERNFELRFTVVEGPSLG